MPRHAIIEQVLAALEHEPRPREFGGRFHRRARGIGTRRRSKRLTIDKRWLILLVAVIVPLLAKPGSWDGWWIGNAGKSEVQLEPMPFERPGDSFPGSAFYYLAPDDQEKYWIQGDSTALAEIGDVGGFDQNVGMVAGPVARALRIDNSGIDRTRALQCLTAAIYYEARSEPDAGQRAVAQVVLNRVAHPSYPNTVCGVVFQGSERTTGCQFSFTCDGSMARKPQPLFWARAEQVASAALSGFVYTPAGLATHYHTIAVHPYWAPKLAYLGTIGAHRFYKFPGAAGQSNAFRFAYGGGEPVAGARARTIVTSGEDKALDPLAIERAYEAGLRAAQANGAAAVAPSAKGLAPVKAAAPPRYSSEIEARGGDAIYRGDKLPQSTGVREEYANSGRWIGKPGQN